MQKEGMPLGALYSIQGLQTCVSNIKSQNPNQ